MASEKQITEIHCTNEAIQGVECHSLQSNLLSLNILLTALFLTA